MPHPPPRGSARLLSRLREALRSAFGGAAPAAAPPPLPPPERVAEADAQFRRGLALDAAGRTAEALEAFQQAVALRHDHVEALLHASRAQRTLGAAEDAADTLGLALAFDPRRSDARLELAALHAGAGGHAAAVALLEEAVDEGHADLAIWSQLARLHKDADDLQAARTAFERALERFPDAAELHLNFGMLWLTRLGDAACAEAHFRRALALQPGLDAARSNLGLALQDLGRLDEAMALYEEGIAANPAFTEYRWNRALARLAQRQFDTGWEDHELRKGRADAGGLHEAFTLPEWDGAPLAGRSILVYAEQGLGDEIMFGSCLPEVVAQARACVIECDARLMPLFARAFPGAVLVPRDRAPRDWRALHPGLDLQCATGSLPRFLRRSEAAFPRRAGYLAADPGARAEWRARLETAGHGRLVGLSWRGGTPRTRGHLRSMALADLDPLFALPGARFVILQRDLTDAERTTLAARDNAIVPAPGDDLDALAALLAALDHLVAVPSALVHLAGALGRPALVMLAPAPEWRYGVAGERMPWYPSLRLLRQDDSGRAGLVLRARQALAELPPPG